MLKSGLLLAQKMMILFGCPQTVPKRKPRLCQRPRPSPRSPTLIPKPRCDNVLTPCAHPSVRREPTHCTPTLISTPHAVLTPAVLTPPSRCPHLDTCDNRRDRLGVGYALDRRLLDLRRLRVHAQEQPESGLQSKELLSVEEVEMDLEVIPHNNHERPPDISIPEIGCVAWWSTRGRCTNVTRCVLPTAR